MYHSKTEKRAQHLFFPSRERTDLCWFTVYDQHGGILTDARGTDCFAILRHLYREAEWTSDIDMEEQGLYPHTIVLYGNNNNIAMTPTLKQWEQWVVSYPAWKGKVRKCHKSNRCEDWEWHISTDLAPNSLLALLCCLRNMWSRPVSCYAYKILTKHRGLPPNMAALLSMSVSKIGPHRWSFYPGNHNSGPHLINNTVINFLIGEGNPEDTKYSQTCRYTQISSFISDNGPDVHRMPVSPEDKSTIEHTISYLYSLQENSQ